MIIVCKNHIKEGVILLNVPHIQKLPQKYWEHTCIFCDEPAHFKLFYSIPIIEKNLIKFKNKYRAS
jgi:hypothetical protein